MRVEGGATEPSRPSCRKRGLGNLRMAVRSMGSARGPGRMRPQPPGGKGFGAHAQSVLILERRTPEHLKVTTLRGASMMG
jgi:hypothetical protein